MFRTLKESYALKLYKELYFNTVVIPMNTIPQLG